MFFSRLAALAELLLVLAVGNLLGVYLFGFLVPPSIEAGTASELTVSFFEGLRILMRLGLAAVFGFALLYFRRRTTPVQAGLTRAGHSTGQLVKQGLVMGLLAGFLVALLFAAHELVPFGQGLEAWWTYSETPVDTAFWVYLLGTSILIPPLTEEILIRGYFRVRLVESFGVMSGVILTGIVFGLSHTRYLQGDSMLLLFMLIILVNSVTWTYLTQKTGSIIPAFVAHALSNGIGSAILFNVWIPLVISVLAVVICSKPILGAVREFFKDCRQDDQLGVSGTDF